jgi:hypothetical protein
MTRTHLLALAALVPAAVLAQSGTAEPDAAAGSAAAAVDDGTVAIPPVDASVPIGDAGGTTPDTYTVVSGDTLWDLSGRFLNNPWYWPKIWSYNPEISNPHWIYPGNLLRFYPSAEEAPARVEPMIAEESELEPPRELEDFSRADLKAPAPVEEEDAVAVAGPYKIGYVPPRQRLARHDTFVTPRELAESGKIEAAFEEKIMLASLDHAYARFETQAKVSPGETYVVYKTDRAIYHPVTNELFGYQSTVLGSAKVVAVDDRAATLVVAQALEPIERGALLGPWTDKIVRPIERRPNRQTLDGRIIASQVDIVTQVGEHHVVIVDRGQADGVEEGNVFKVVRSGDLYDRDPYVAPWDPDLPPEDVGDLLVIDVKERASTALVTRSLKELVIGDRVEMRPASTGSAGN